MTDRRAFFVVGSESSGTRLATRLLIDAGCFGDAGHEQRLDREPWSLGRGPVVWRRSYPHDGRMPSLAGMQDRAVDHGYGVKCVVVTVRDWWATCASMTAEAKHARSELEASSKIRDAYLRIFTQIHETGLGCRMLVYESLVARPVDTVRRLVDDLGLRMPHPFPEVYDANVKYLSVLRGGTCAS